jgi:peroxiredoxin
LIGFRWRGSRISTIASRLLPPYITLLSHELRNGSRSPRGEGLQRPLETLMNTWKRRLVCAVVAGLAVFVLLRSQPTRSQQDSNSPLVGKPAPDLEGDLALNGKAAKLADFKGKIVLIDFWAVWSLPCVECLPGLTELHKKYKGVGLEVIGVTAYNYDMGRNFGFDATTGKLTKADSATKASEQALLKDFAAHYKMDFLVLALPKDDAIRTFEAYGAKHIPHMVLVDRKGIVRMVRTGGAEDNMRQIEMELKKLLAEKD